MENGEIRAGEKCNGERTEERRNFRSWATCVLEGNFCLLEFYDEVAGDGMAVNCGVGPRRGRGGEIR